MKTNILTFAGIFFVSLLVSTAANAFTPFEIPDEAIYGHVQTIRAFASNDGAGSEDVTGSNESRLLPVIYTMTVNIIGDATYTYSGQLKRYSAVTVVVDTDLDSKTINLQYETAMKNYAQSHWNATLTKYVWQPYSKP